MQWLAERVSEVEERLDLLAQTMQELAKGGVGDGDSAPTSKRTFPTVISDAARKDENAGD